MLQQCIEICSQICNNKYGGTNMNKDLKIKHGFTLAEVFSVHPKGGRKQAFTLAEVLITLGIIGVVAAMTLPVLIQKHQKKATVTKLKKAYSNIQNVLLSSYNDNGYMSDYFSYGEVINPEKAKEYIEQYWLKYLRGSELFYGYPYGKNKHNNQYDQPYHYANGTPLKINLYTGNTGLAQGKFLFSTSDGTIYYLTILEWEHDDEEEDKAIPVFNKIQIYIDTNGVRKPNTLGKDLFYIQINAKNNKIMLFRSNRSNDEVINDCKNTGHACITKIINDGWQIKDDYPW